MSVYKTAITGTPQPYAHVIIKLLQGVVYYDSGQTWNDLLQYQKGIESYFSQIGVRLFVAETDGFAYIKRRDPEDEAADEEQQDIPDLFIKRQLGYQVSLLCVLLLEELIKFDTAGGDMTRLILSKDHIKNLVKTFLPDSSNEAKHLDAVDTNINRLLEYGFIKKLRNDKEEYEVKRILKAKIDGSKLSEIKENLEKYARTDGT